MTTPSNTSSMPGALPGAKHATYATQLTGRIQDQGEKTQLPDPCGAVENPSIRSQIHDHTMRDTFGGYDWGDPIRLWTVPNAAPKQRRIHGEHADQPVRPCDRCGIPRVVRVGRNSPLCADCRFVLSREEIALWAGEKAAA